MISAGGVSLTIRGLRTVAVKVPMKHALGTSAATVRQAPLLLFDLETEEGVIGRSYQFCYTPAAAAAIARMAADACEALRGARVEPITNWARLAKRYTLIGVQGIVRMAMSMLDVASWDALAIAARQPLATYLGGTLRPVPAYNSCGLGLMSPDEVANEALALLEGSFKAIKLRLGYETLAQDLAAINAVRRNVPEGVAVMTDYNQALSLAEALYRSRALERENVYWIEEPIRHDDYAGCAKLAREISTPIQIGENFSQVFDMEKALVAGSCDYVMPDLERIGGVTGWQRAASLAYAAGVAMSSHLYPEVSAHLLCATPTAHWLEYVDWANEILEEPPVIEEGNILPSSSPGNGLRWNEEAIRRYRVE